MINLAIRNIFVLLLLLLFIWGWIILQINGYRAITTFMAFGFACINFLLFGSKTDRNISGREGFFIIILVPTFIIGLVFLGRMESLRFLSDRPDITRGIMIGIALSFTFWIITKFLKVRRYRQRKTLPNQSLHRSP